MNTKTIEKRINRDLDRTKRDLAALKENAVSGLSWKIGQMTDKPRKDTVEALRTLNKSIGQGLTQYNNQVQHAVNRVPGDINKKAAHYPWVAASMAMLLGLILGVALKPSRRMIASPEDNSIPC